MINSPFAKTIIDNPLFVDPTQSASVEAMLDHVAANNPVDTVDAIADADGEFWSSSTWVRPYNVQNGVLKIQITGMLLNNFPYQMGQWATGYEYIAEALNRGLGDTDVNAIALMVNSPGGVVNGCFDLSDFIYESRDMKPIKSFVAGGAYSAAYALASAASEIIVGRSGGTGSVGVVTSHIDYSESMKQAGIVRTLVFKGKRKVDANPYEKLSAVALANIEKRLERLYTDFVETIARNRGMSVEDVRQTEAMLYDAQDSVSVGFADIVGKTDDKLVEFENSGEQMETIEMTDKATFTQADVDKALSDGIAQGAANAQVRMTAIMGSDEAAARPIAAQTLLTSPMAADVVITMLGKLPEETAAAPEPAPTPAPAPEASGNDDATDKLAAQFDAGMTNGAPNVGADADDGPAEPSAHAGMDDYKAMVAAEAASASAA